MFCSLTCIRNFVLEKLKQLLDKVWVLLFELIKISLGTIII